MEEELNLHMQLSFKIQVHMQKKNYKKNYWQWN